MRKLKNAFLLMLSTSKHFFVLQNGKHTSAFGVSNVRIKKRMPDNGLWDIFYTLSGRSSDLYSTSIKICGINNSDLELTPSAKALTGDVGNHVSTGEKHIIWRSTVDFKDCITHCHAKIFADSIGPGGIIWVNIECPEFHGQISKHEVTNAQYCAFLNTALANGDIIVDGNYVKGARGLSLNLHYPRRIYYHLGGQGWSCDSINHGGAARISFSGYSFAVTEGFHTHPVTYVSWYGASAFCNHYGYRLPLSSEWQCAALYDKSYVYGCGPSIDSKIANFRDSIHPHGTTVVGEYGEYGYGLSDMAGNVWEWTKSFCDNKCISLGGSWLHFSINCKITSQFIVNPESTYCHTGFRVCR